MRYTTSTEQRECGSSRCDDGQSWPRNFVATASRQSEQERCAAFRKQYRATYTHSLLTFLLPLAACAPEGSGSSAWRAADISVPVRDDGSVASLVGRVCRPAIDAPAPVVVIAHGSPPSAADRPAEALAGCDDEAPSWFLSRGFVVVQTLRRGYGATGGQRAENYGSCSAPDFQAGLQTARDITATVDVATALPYARPHDAVVVGQSAGAWDTLAHGSEPHPKVAALVAMAPGHGGHRHGEPNENCAPDHLVAAAGRYGATSRGGILWVNTANDSYFGPDLVQARPGHAGCLPGQWRCAYAGASRVL